MPRNELRLSGLLQAALIALVLGALLRQTPASAPTVSWPYFVAGYGFLAATLPWLAGGLTRDALSLRLSGILGLVFALPVALAAWWLQSSPYVAIRIGCWSLVGLWCVHLLAALTLYGRERGRILKPK